MTAEEARRLFAYDPITGVLTRRVKMAWRTRAGEVVGSLMNTGYLQTHVGPHGYLVHRIAWLLSYGEWPKGFIDHINGCITDNRLENLRVTDSQGNQENRRKAQKNNSTGFMGATVVAQSKKFRARITVDGKERYLGLFDTPEEAHAVYLDAKRKQHKCCTI